MLRITKKISSPIQCLLGLTVFSLLAASPAYAQLGGGLTQSVSLFQQIKAWLWLIIPICALIIGGLIGLAYSADMIRKETCIQWVTGVIISGVVAGGIVSLVFNTTV